MVITLEQILRDAERETQIPEVLKTNILRKILDILNLDEETERN